MIIHLSHPVPSLRRINFPPPKIIPKVNFTYAIGRSSPELKWLANTLPTKLIKLKGDFKTGKKYKVIWPKNLTLSGRTYSPSKETFIVTPPPELEFGSYAPIIERKGRQLLHLKTNIDTFNIQSIRIPPISSWTHTAH